MHRHVVPAGVPATPLKQYLSRAFPALPGWLVRETLKRKDVRVNGVRSGADAFVRSGDELFIYADERYFALPVRVIYEDEELFVVEKPAGIPVDSDQSGIGADTMLGRIRSIHPSARLCHRLDTYTGGILIAAKDKKSEKRMEDAFRAHEPQKYYQCVVSGNPPSDSACLSAWLQKDAGAARVRVIDHPAPKALPIETRYRVLSRRGELTKLEVHLITGRTHQIRAHLSHVNLPVLGDDKYGNREVNRRLKISHPLLWCVRIDFDGHSFESQPQFAPFDF